MTSLAYDASPHPVRAALAAAQVAVWERLGKPGTWLDGEERIAVCREIRHARGCALCARQKAALSPYTVQGEHDTIAGLPALWVEVVHRVVADPGRLTKGWFDRITRAGMPIGAYVEIVSLIAHLTAIDTFTRALDLPLHPLPAPQPGQPSRYRPAEAHVSDAWVPTITWGESGPEEADLLVGQESNIRRGLTLVPDEVRSFFGLGEHQYLTWAERTDFTRRHRAISNVQVELVAARVSALNQCTY
jgi:alkylhydroperoxidase family enzyme